MRFKTMATAAITVVALAIGGSAFAQAKTGTTSHKGTGSGPDPVTTGAPASPDAIPAAPAPAADSTTAADAKPVAKKKTAKKHSGKMHKTM